MTYFKRYRMEYDLHQGVFPRPEIPLNYTGVTWCEDLVDEHAETKFYSFQFEIDANVFPCLGNRDGCHRLMREISARNNFLPNATILLYYRETGRAPEPCGTIQAIRDNLGRGSIQNIGVTPEHRGHRLGSYLVYRSLQEFAQQGIRLATLEVTAQNTQALRLYKRLGFKITRTVFKAAEVTFA
ncbi:MAG: N-acetyltransferase [Planctomycetota bacterium]|nr:N-acetyltransferase [Planctomycetota bacterium]